MELDRRLLEANEETEILSAYIAADRIQALKALGIPRIASSREAGSPLAGGCEHVPTSSPAVAERPAFTKLGR